MISLCRRNEAMQRVDSKSLLANNEISSKFPYNSCNIEEKPTRAPDANSDVNPNVPESAVSIGKDILLERIEKLEETILIQQEKIEGLEAQVPRLWSAVSLAYCCSLS